MNKLIFFILLLYSAISYACIVPGNKLASEPEIMVSEAKLIIWGKAVAMEKIESYEHANIPVKYKFEIIEKLKGTYSSKKFELRGDGEIEDLWDTTFTGHTEPRFIENYHGRLGNIGDCVTTPPPVFKLGENYLLFIGGSDDSKKYERVDSQSDRWYQKVKSLVKKNGI